MIKVNNTALEINLNKEDKDIYKVVRLRVNNECKQTVKLNSTKDLEDMIKHYDKCFKGYSKPYYNNQLITLTIEDFDNDNVLELVKVDMCNAINHK